MLKRQRRPIKRDGGGNVRLSPGPFGVVRAMKPSHKTTVLRACYLVVFSTVAQLAWSQTLPPRPAFGLTLVEPCKIQDLLSGHQGLLVVPENRRKADSRAI